MTTRAMSDQAAEGLRLLTEKANTGRPYAQLTDLPRWRVTYKIKEFCWYIGAKTDCQALWRAERVGLIDPYQPEPGQPPPSIDQLNEIEKAIVIRLANGQTTREIAVWLSTVKNKYRIAQNITNIMMDARRKVGAQNQLQLVYMVRRLLEPTPTA